MTDGLTNEVQMQRIEALYNKHAAGVLTMLRRMNCDSPDDLLHETFVQAMRRADKLFQAQSQRAWLIGIARNLALSTRRRNKHVLPLSMDIPAALPAKKDDRLEAMAAAIAALPDVQREALELRLHEELTYEEISHVLGIPVGTVRSRLHNAVESLKEKLSP